LTRRWSIILRLTLRILRLYDHSTESRIPEEHNIVLEHHRGEGLQGEDIAFAIVLDTHFDLVDRHILVVL
jgi:hypothetical protein